MSARAKAKRKRPAPEPETVPRGVYVPQWRDTWGLQFAVAIDSDGRERHRQSFAPEQREHVAVLMRGLLDCYDPQPGTSRPSDDYPRYLSALLRLQEDAVATTEIWQNLPSNRELRRRLRA